MNCLNVLSALSILSVFEVFSRDEISIVSDSLKVSRKKWSCLDKKGFSHFKLANRNTQCIIHFSRAVQKNTSSSYQSIIVFCLPSAQPRILGGSAYSSATPKCQLSQVPLARSLNCLEPRYPRIPIFFRSAAEGTCFKSGGGVAFCQIFKTIYYLNYILLELCSIYSGKKAYKMTSIKFNLS